MLLFLVIAVVIVYLVNYLIHDETGGIPGNENSSEAASLSKEEEEKGGVRDQKSVKNKGQDIANSFLRYFKSNDRYGKRFQTGPLVSKWGLFPVDFEKLSLEIKVPENFTVITSYESSWQDVKKGKKVITYKTVDTDNYSDAIFLPESDKEEQLKTMEILKSDFLKR